MDSKLPQPTLPQDRRALREGVTTGTCAAGAAKAAVLRQLEGVCPERVEVEGPTGRRFVLDVKALPDGSCGVVKDAGDDIDATDGLMIVASVALGSEPGEVIFAAGEGIGTVTLPGLKVPPGEPAINPAPRAMIRSAVREAAGDRAARVTLSIPGGAAVAARTFNPRLGIEGGLSILGTTGVVRPMDESALLESLSLEVSILASLGLERLVLTFGATGEASARRCFGLEGRCVIQAGNYPGHVLDEAVRLGFRRCLFCGHPGKLLKVAAGSFNTHNRVADGRMEALCTHLALAGAPVETLREVYDCRTTEAAMGIVAREGLDFVWTKLAQTTAQRCVARNFGQMAVEVAFIDNEGGLLGRALVQVQAQAEGEGFD
ncbi:MAG: cobalamin biosynthesis protein CbiD [Fretibacterium sp.]|nr:cobalamin biosynthesis protein CbiD [Fretibacterium sp.]